MCTSTVRETVKTFLINILSKHFEPKEWLENSATHFLLAVLFTRMKSIQRCGMAQFCDDTSVTNCDYYENSSEMVQIRQQRTEH